MAVKAIAIVAKHASFVNGILACSHQISQVHSIMGTVFTLDQPAQVRTLILLAPALMLDPIASLSDPKPVSVPTIMIHGTLDTVVPLEPVRQTVQKLFMSVKYYVVEDDHRLHKTVHELDWNSILD